MALDADAVRWLRTPEGAAAARDAVAALAAGTPLLKLIDTLRRTHTAEEARWAVTLAEGRTTAAAKFTDASELFFDREAAEQATSDVVSRYTARRFAGASRIVDLGCGAGADALALSGHAPVVAIDLDEGRVAMTEANAHVRGADIEARVGDALEADLDGFDAAWLDPARRDGSGRVLDPERWSPPLSAAIRVARRVRSAGIKVAPGIELAAVPGDAEIEFISLDGRLVEAVIWLGDAVTAPRRASVLPSGESLHGAPEEAAPTLGEPGTYLYDLDPGVGRAGLVVALAERLGAWHLSEGVAYLSSDEPRETPFARRFRVRQWFAFSERRILEACQAAGASRVEVMRRASPVETNELETRLNRDLPGGAGLVLTVVLTRLVEEHVAIVCERER
ncbi:MAG: methyltransferase domain-containing protein [Dehalococcoidia bacterium]|nr:methyltransferase domain-containing protein [Dehalococcoidia bacterium]